MFIYFNNFVTDIKQVCNRESMFTTEDQLSLYSLKFLSLLSLNFVAFKFQTVIIARKISNSSETLIHHGKLCTGVEFYPFYPYTDYANLGTKYFSLVSNNFRSVKMYNETSLNLLTYIYYPVIRAGLKI